MDINFDQLLKDAQKPAEVEPLFACVCGARGSGKSTLVSTTGGDTLFITVKKESHGISSAKSLGAVIVPIILDKDTDSPDEVVSNLKSILTNAEVPKKFKAVAIDSLSELDFYVNQHSNVQKAAKFKESEAVEIIYSDIIKLLRGLHSQGLHVLVTLAAEAEIDKNTGENVTVVPTLRGYNMVNKVLGAFSDIFIVGPMTEQQEDGGTKPRYLIQFGGKFTKSGKKMSGEARSLTFNPRLSGVPASEMPEEGFFVASLRKLIEFKKDALNRVREKLAASKKG